MATELLKTFLDSCITNRAGDWSCYSFMSLEYYASKIFEVHIEYSHATTSSLHPPIRLLPPSPPRYAHPTHWPFGSRFDHPRLPTEKHYIWVSLFIIRHYPLFFSIVRHFTPHWCQFLKSFIISVYLPAHSHQYRSCTSPTLCYLLKPWSLDGQTLSAQCRVLVALSQS